MFRKGRGVHQHQNKSTLAGNMERGGYRGDLGRACGGVGLAGVDYDYNDGYNDRSYDRLMRGAEGYLDSPPLREAFLGGPLGGGCGGGGYRTGRGGVGGGYYDHRESELMETLMQQRALEQQLSLRESQLALTNSLLRQQQEQQQQFLNKGWLDGGSSTAASLRGGGEFREDFKPPRVVYNRAQPKKRLNGQDSNAGGKAMGTRGGSGNQRNPNAPNGHGQGSADPPAVKELEKTQEASKSKKNRRFKRVGKKEMDADGEGRSSSGSAASLRDSVKPQTESRNSGSGTKTVDGGASPDAASITDTSQDADGSKGSKKTCNPEGPTSDDDVGTEKSSLGKLRCSLCNVDCKDKEELRQHKSSSEHMEKVASAKGGKDPSGKESSGGYCYVCDLPLKVLFKYHQRLPCHKLQVEKKKMSQKQKMQVNLGCGWCKIVSFNNFSEVVAHRATKEHIKNQALYGKKNKGGEETDSKSMSDPAGGNGKSSRKEPEVIKVDLPPELSEFDPDVGVGETCLLEVTGWFCKVCNKFCNSETTSKDAHCKTEPHFNGYKKFVYNKLKAEAKREARQKAAEEEQIKKELESAAESKEGDNDDGDSAHVPPTDPPTEQPEVHHPVLTSVGEGAEPERVAEEKGTEEAESESGSGGEEDQDDDDSEATAEDSAEPSQEGVEDLQGLWMQKKIEGIRQDKVIVVSEESIEGDGGEAEGTQEEEEVKEEEMDRKKATAPTTTTTQQPL